MIAIAIAAAALVCSGSGVVVHRGPPRTDPSRSGRPWLDAYNDAHDGFVATTAFDPAALTMTPPAAMAAPATPLRFVETGRRGAIIDAVHQAGATRLTLAYDEGRGTLVLAASDGVYSALCRRSE